MNTIDDIKQQVHKVLVLVERDFPVSMQIIVLKSLNKSALLIGHILILFQHTFAHVAWIDDIHEDSESKLTYWLVLRLNLLFKSKHSSCSL